MKVVAVSFKECWQGEDGNWFSDGGFPRQMDALMSLFDVSDLLVVEVPRRAGGIALPGARVIPLREPKGQDFRRKLSVLANLPYYVREIASAARSADVVHTPLPGDIPLIGMLVGWACGKPVLARYGGSWAATRETTLMNRITRGIMRLMARGGHVILATGDGAERPAEGMEWIFSSALSRNEIEGIQPGLDRGLAANPRLVYIGRLSPEKGVANLIKALSRLMQNPEIQQPVLLVAGDGPERRALTGLSRTLGCDDRIRFLGQLDRRQLSEVLLDADLCVQPSLTEGFSKAWLDAMAHGLPVLSSDVGAARSVIGARSERGWLVPPDDVDALTAMLTTVLSMQTDWPQLRRRCRAFAEGRTLEEWRDQIGLLCAQRWIWSVHKGKLIR